MPSFRALFTADTVSTVGDQFARVALAVLVFDRTGSAWWSAVIYALTFIPDLVGSFALAWVADYYPRRTVIVTSSLVQAVSFALMAIPGIPLWMVAVLVCVSATALAPSRAAQGALVVDVVDGVDAELQRAGQGLLDQSRSTGQVLGLAAGGSLAAAIGPSPVLLLNAVTFVVSAVVVAGKVPARPAPGGTRRPMAQWRDTLVVLRADRELIALIALAWMATIIVVPDGVVAPLAAELGRGQSAVGLLLAAHPFAQLVTLAVINGRTADRWKRQLLWLLATFAVLPLVGFFLEPGLCGALALLAVSGAGTVYITFARADVAGRLPERVRGTAGALIRTGLRVGQGVGVVIGGAAAQLTGSTMVTLGAAGVAGCCWVAAAGAIWNRAKAPERPTGTGAGAPR